MNQISIHNKLAIAFDIDGTLLNSKHQLSAENIAAIKRLHDFMHVAVASARPPNSVKKIAKSREINGPIISLNGAYVTNSTNNHKLLSQIIPQHSVENIHARFKEKKSILLNSYSSNLWHATQNNHLLDEEIVAIGYRPDKIDNTITPTEVNKILLIGSPKNIDACMAYCQTLRGICCSHSQPGYLEITANHVSKLSALNYLSKIIQLDLKDMIYVGDGENDIDAIQAAGYGIAMQNANENVQSVADRVIGNNNSNAIANFVNELIATRI